MGNIRAGDDCTVVTCPKKTCQLHSQNGFSVEGSGAGV